MDKYPLDTDPAPVEDGEFGCDQPRIIALSDGVFAFAMTLLVLGVFVDPGLPLARLPAAMLEQLPQLVPYITCFGVISAIWDSHQRMMRRISYCSPGIVWANLLLLLFVTFLPANSKLVGDYPAAALAVTSLAVNVALLQLTAIWMTWYAARTGLMDERVKPEVWQKVLRNYSLIAATFLLSIPVAFVSTQLAKALWLVALAGGFIAVQHSIGRELQLWRARRERANRG